MRHRRGRGRGRGCEGRRDAGTAGPRAHASATGTREGHVAREGATKAETRRTRRERGRGEPNRRGRREPDAEREPKGGRRRDGERPGEKQLAAEGRYRKAETPGSGTRGESSAAPSTKRHLDQKGGPREGPVREDGAGGGRGGAGQAWGVAEVGVWAAVLPAPDLRGAVF